MTIEQLVRPNIRDLVPYSSARSQYQTGLLLDANENAFGSVLDSEQGGLNRYPDPFQRELRAQLAAYEGVSPSSIFAGVGSDEIIDLLVRVLCEPRKDSIHVLEPTYGMYRVAAMIQEIRTDTVRLSDDFQIDLHAVLQAIRPETKIIFCCSPNNPTGNLLRRDDVLGLCRAVNAVVVVDEAYVDFADRRSMANECASTPNLVVMKTLSKSWGLAGIRLGYCIADPVLVAFLDKVKPPYNINVLTASVAAKALKAVAVRDELVGRIRNERTRLAQALAGLSFVEHVYPSDANFLLVRCTDHTSLLSYLSSRSIVIRDRSSQPGLERCVRITVGTPEENDRLLAAMKDYRRD